MSVTLLRANYAKTLRANCGAKLLKIPDLCKCLYNFYIKTPLLFALFAVVPSRIPSGFPLSFHVLALCVHRDFIGTSSEPHRDFTESLPIHHRYITDTWYPHKVAFMLKSQHVSFLYPCIIQKNVVLLQAESIKPPTIRTEASVQKHIEYSVISKTWLLETSTTSMYKLTHLLLWLLNNPLYMCLKTFQTLMEELAALSIGGGIYLHVLSDLE
jgi:hypothetical protein